MKLFPESIPFLNGSRFDDDYCLKLISTDDPADRGTIDRISLLERLVGDKKIVHVGCVDHSAALIERESARGTWLHGRLSGVAHQCVGIDINDEGILYLKKTLGIEDVFCCDLTCEALPLAADQPFDFLLLGEILEHVDNPVGFLTTLRQKHFPHGVRSMIVTVPNALRERNYRDSRNDQERINSDHRYWFSPFSIAKVLTEAGYEIDDIYLVRHKPLKNPGTRGFKSWNRRRLQKKHPFLRDTIVVTATVRNIR